MSARAKNSTKRGGQTVRRGKSAKVSPRRTERRLSLLSRVLAAQPFSPAAVRRIIVTSLVSAFLFVGYQVAAYTGTIDRARQDFVAAVGRAGFSVKRIEVVGAQRIDRMHVYDIALQQQDRSMAAFDLAEVRRDLMTYGWVADARVSRRLPDTLIIDLVERTPVAIWQNRGNYSLIDKEGIVLPGVDPATMGDLPILAGERANERIGELEELLKAAPALRPRLAGASWIGNRRWDLRFKSGEILALPEERDAASAAFADFARMDGINRLLGRGIRRFDMRIRDRLVLRPGREGDLGNLGPVATGDDRRVSTEPAVTADGG